MKDKKMKILIRKNPCKSAEKKLSPLELFTAELPTVFRWR
jgi:hypothetical protein